MSNSAAETEVPPVLYCANHPTVETTLRCNRCEKPICIKCAVLTPTGYRCKECVRGQQKIFETDEWYDYPLAIVVAGLLSFLGSLLVAFVGFFTLFVAPVAGFFIAEAVRLVLRKHRSRRLFLTAAVAAAAGSLPLLVPAVLALLGGTGTGAVLALLWQGLYTFTVAPTVFYRLSGIQIK